MRTDRLGLLLAGAATLVGIAALTLGIVALANDQPESVGEWIIVQFVPGFVVSGWWLTRRRPQLVLGWLFLIAAVTVGVAALAGAWAAAALVLGWGGAAWALWTFSWMWLPHSSLLAIAFLLFPDGVVRTAYQRLALRLTYGSLAVAMAMSLLRPGTIVTTPDKPDGAVPGLVNPLGISALDGFLDAIALPVLASQFVIGLLPGVWAVVQWRRSEGLRRRQFRVLTIVVWAGLVVPLALLALPLEYLGFVAIAYTLASQVLIVVAILQWRAYEVNVVVRRSVLAGSLLAAGMVVYGAAVLIVSLLIGRTGSIASVIGAAVAIVTFGPLSVVIRRSVNRLFYGNRDDPYLVVSETGRRLTGASDPAAGVAELVAALTESLRVPYAAVTDHDGAMLASSGHAEESGEPVSVPVVHQGEELGHLRVAHRRGSPVMSDAESALLADLANQLGPSLAALELVTGLRQAQQRLVVTRDEERRRIQRDLHDGLGSALTAVTLKLDAARNHLRNGDDEVGNELVATARNDVQSALADVRRLVYSLGDPTLTAQGLASALREQVRALTLGGAVHTVVDVDDVGRLPLQIEEAVYRIVVEAVTNVVRHSEAEHCTVRVSLAGASLEAVVDDDGRGLGGRPPGLGHRAMTARAGELGGELTFATNPAGGTTVRLSLGLVIP